MIVPGKGTSILLKILRDESSDFDGSQDFSAAALSQGNPNEGGDEGKSFKVPKYFQALLTLVICGILIATILCLISKVKFWCQKFSTPKSQQSSQMRPRLKSFKVVIQEPSFDLDEPQLNRPKNGQISNEKCPNGGATSDLVEGNSVKSPAGISGSKENSCAEKNQVLISSSAVPKQDMKRTPSPRLAKMPRQVVIPEDIIEGEGDLTLQPQGQHVQYFRRVSGPFNEEALEFANDTYSSAGKPGQSYSFRASRKFHHDKKAKEKEQYHS